MAMEYRVWNYYAGAMEDDEVFKSARERDAKAKEIADDLASPRNEEEWQVFIADVTAECSVGEWAGEEAQLYASNEES